MSEPIIYINREELNKYCGEETKLILNGWFMHEPQNWPPSSNIFPFFISFHINSVAYRSLLSEKSIKFLKKWEPIGCRDKKTATLLMEKGVNAYFSCCLTLTLSKKYLSNKTRDKIYFVDPYYEYRRDILSIIWYVWSFIKNSYKLLSLSRKLFGNIHFRSILKTTAYYLDYRKIFDDEIILEASYISHLVRELEYGTEDEKFVFADGIIRKYAKAKLIVTSKIHCALPCLGLETPVIFIENGNQSETSYCRLEGIRELLNIVIYKKHNMKILFNNEIKKISIKDKINNKSDYLRFEKHLEEQCMNYIKK